jgi:catechol 2,3-dioxygenase-like lactoylglutathione lyase family enzyme
MTVTLNRIGQIALGVSDVDRAETFYQDTLGLRKLYHFGDLAFFDCAGVRLLLEKTHDPDTMHPGSPLYFVRADIALAVQALRERGMVFASPPHLIARMDDHDLWMAFFADPDGNPLALMREAPKGHVPPAV